MGQPQLTRFRQLQVTTPVASPTDSPSSSPQFTLSPTAPSAQPTTGFLFMLKIPAGSTATGPFTVTPWVRDPVTGFWGSGTTSTAVSAGDLFSCFDIDAAETFFAVTATANGVILLLVGEQ
jgi:hypothetical protein